MVISMNLVTDIISRGFAAKAPAKVLETVQAWGNDYHGMCLLPLLLLGGLVGISSYTSTYMNAADLYRQL